MTDALASVARPGSHDYDAALDSQACLELSRASQAALEAELAELRRRSQLRSAGKPQA